MRARALIVSIALTILPAKAGELSHSYQFTDQSLQYGRCLDDAQSMSDIRRCMGQEVKHQDARLTMAYHDAMARLSPEGRHHLQEAERAWIKWRDDECRPTPGTGSAGATDSLLCQIKQIMCRAAELEHD